jgi:hypothetical protein
MKSRLIGWICFGIIYAFLWMTLSASQGILEHFIDWWKIKNALWIGSSLLIAFATVDIVRNR